VGEVSLANASIERWKVETLMLGGSFDDEVIQKEFEEIQFFMMRYSLTKNEARVLRAMDDLPQASLYEIASRAQLTSTEVDDAAKLLSGRTLIRLDPDNRVLMLTIEGQAVQQSLLRTAATGSRAQVTPEVSIVSDDEAASEAALSEMSSDELESAFNEELGKLEAANESGD